MKGGSSLAVAARWEVAAASPLAVGILVAAAEPVLVAVVSQLEVRHLAAAELYSASVTKYSRFTSSEESTERSQNAGNVRSRHDVARMS